MKPEFNRIQQLREAADLLRKGIELLDRAGAPAEIAAHVDLARSHIETLCVNGDPIASVNGAANELRRNG